MNRKAKIIGTPETIYETDPFWSDNLDMPPTMFSYVWNRFLRLLKLAGLAS